MTEAEFWSRVDVRGPDECWPWKRALHTSGYGQAHRDGKSIGAHRIALEYKLGRPVQQHALHSCDNRACCNPAHLREGTQSDNSRDMVARGRSLRGERAPKADLTQEAVDLIRQCHEDGLSTREIAQIAAVSQSTVSRIISGRIWNPCIAYGAPTARSTANADAPGHGAVVKSLRKAAPTAG